MRADLAGLTDTGVVFERFRDGYSVSVDPMSIDVFRFQHLVRVAGEAPTPAARVGALREALALWRGQALADIGSDGMRDRLCAHLEQARQSALESLLEAELDSGRHREVLGELTEAVAETPHSDRLAALLILAHHRCNDRPSALCERTRMSAGGSGRISAWIPDRIS